MIFSTRRFALVLPLLITLTFSSISASAGSRRDCEAKLGAAKGTSLGILREKSAARAKAGYAKVAAPGFDNLEEQVLVEQVGEVGPRALQDILSKDMSFLSTPAPTSADPVAVDLLEEGRSVALHLDIPFKGKRTSTAVYASLPRRKVESAGGYLVDIKDYPVVQISLHGGGTPTATGRNGMSIGKELSKRGIPVIGLDLPGHGRATRSLEGLLEFYGMVDWLMEAIEKLVHPGVRIELEGHSWGAEFVLFMHRLSANPRYKQIARYIAISPPIDVSLGTSKKAKADFAAYWEKHYAEFEARIAPTDFEFLKNILRNGKNSDVGGYFTSLSDLDFFTPPYTEEELKTLKPLNVIVGSADGLVYVGREEKFQQIFAALSGESSFTLLGPGLTWKSKNDQDLQLTGHNVFDLYAPGTKNLLVYKMLGDLILGEGKSLPLRETTASNDAGDAAVEMVDRYFRNYANFFAFRELVKDRTEYVQTDTPERMKISMRKGEIEDYLKRVAPVEAEIAKAEDGKVNSPEVNKAVEELRARLGINENLSLKRAQEELAMEPMTPEREAALKEFVKQVDLIEEDMKTSHVDTQYDEDVARLEREHAKLMTELGMASLSEYAPHMKRYLEMKNPNPKDAKTRGDLSRIHQRMAEFAKKKMSRYGVARDARVAALDLPEGVGDYRAAVRELSADRSEERRKKLQAYVGELERVEIEARARVIGGLTEKLRGVTRPAGIENPDEARTLVAELNERLSMTWAPADDAEIAAAAERVRELDAQMTALSEGDASTASLEKLQSTVRDLRNKRASAMRAFEQLWARNKVSSDAVMKKHESVEREYSSYEEVNLIYEGKKGEWLLAAKESGNLTVDAVLNSTPELKSLRRKVQKAKAQYFADAAELEALKAKESMAGNITGEAGAVKEAQKLANEIWGGAGSLSANLKVEEEYLDARQAHLSVLRTEYDEARIAYAQAMAAKGLVAPFEITGVSISAALDIPLEDLLERLKNDPVVMAAFRQVLAEWDGYHARMRSESHQARAPGDVGGY